MKVTDALKLLSQGFKADEIREMMKEEEEEKKAGAEDKKDDKKDEKTPVPSDSADKPAEPKKTVPDTDDEDTQKKVKDLAEENEKLKQQLLEAQKANINKNIDNSNNNDTRTAYERARDSVKEFLI